MIAVLKLTIPDLSKAFKSKLRFSKLSQHPGPFQALFGEEDHNRGLPSCRRIPSDTRLDCAIPCATFMDTSL